MLLRCNDVGYGADFELLGRSNAVGKGLAIQLYREVLAAGVKTGQRNNIRCEDAVALRPVMWLDLLVKSDDFSE